MDYKFVPKHLLLPEIDYELKIRGSFTNRDRAEKIKILSRLLFRESQGSELIDLEDYDSTFEEEREAINDTAVSIASLILEFEGNPKDTLLSRIRSRIAHLTGRVQRLEVSDDSENKKTYKQEMYITCLSLDADVHEKIKSDVDITDLNAGVLAQQPVINVTTPPLSCSNNNFSLHKWNIKFSGDANTVFNFLEKVTDYATARNVSDEVLFEGFIELVEGKAFTWYRSVKSSVLNWEDLKTKLKNDFLPPNYEDEIWEQIKARKQRKGEPVVLFFAELENLFNRISRIVCEATRVKFLRQNLLPDYLSHIALSNTDTVQELLAVVKRLEEAEYFKNKNIAYRESRNKVTPLRRTAPQVSEVAEENLTVPSVSDSKNENASKTLICWNCQKSGHTYTSCKFKRNKFCFRCGAKNVTVNSCKKCSKN
jgi:hypothetical protein